ncbi:MaoC dehydratase-like protein [Tamaricihabitans halophyticus]|uniref:MaoC dehydratase-like protein n=1 Tax=Tamaricihabitans halophyticus TaxID=1262583 RepID=A0A4R2QFH0_9PSEU|nr:MaoC/PaaZ C-terminal domain-containing protein [Tamaricihabitans halophyticus]TCP47883.1 MaoC dehydratase-like protein [Tamaricihabitans halophyticus]
MNATTKAADQPPRLPDLVGHDLGTRTARYTERDAMLYALAVGAPAERLGLVYERDLRVLPTYGLTLGLWAVEAAGEIGSYDPLRSLHAAQRLRMYRELPAAGTVELTGRIAAVWDKGKAAMVDIDVDSSYFTATYSIFLPGMGGWGGDRGPASSRGEPATGWRATYRLPDNLAALYRLTGDRHPVHIDPEVATGYGFDRPILHGLCTLGIAARAIADAADRHPCELTELRARFAAPVCPGETLEITAAPGEAGTEFAVHAGATSVLDGGSARFA